MTDPYSVLGIQPTATDAEVKKAYRELARKYHPDNYQNNPLADLAEEKMKEINEAYDAINRARSGAGGGSYASGSQGQAYQRQSYQGSALYQQVRRCINMGDLGQAEVLLQQAPSRDAEWFFLNGSLAYRRGWLDEALQNYNTACQMDPTNPEYRQALSMMQQGGYAYQPPGYSNAQGCDSCDICSTLLCLNCLCGGCN